MRKKGEERERGSEEEGKVEEERIKKKERDGKREGKVPTAVKALIEDFLLPRECESASFFQPPKPNAKVPPSQGSEPSQTERDTTTPWRPLPRIADMSPKNREMRSSSPAPTCSGLTPPPPDG